MFLLWCVKLEMSRIKREEIGIGKLQLHFAGKRGEVIGKMKFGIKYL